MSDEEMARFAVDRWRFPGVELEPYLTRRYPYGDLFAHIIGYVGRVDDKDLEILGEGNAALTHIGKSGLERYYEQQLRGKV
ncbi:penicillin-binding protein, partial [Acinetobacter baumannii]